jgi:hypothetical protein
MNEFRTIVRATPSAHKIALKHRIMTLGSCFSDAIGARLEWNKFTVSINPFGVIYNPVSIHRVLTRASQNEPPFPETYLQNDDVHLNYDLHSSFSALQKDLLEKKVNNAFADSHAFLKNCSWIMITYGTAWVYKLKSSGHIVANCHRQPSHLFEKTLLTTDQMIRSFGDMYNEVKKYNANIKFVLTVSPVRHVKDTLQLNAVSKAVVRIACHEMSERFKDVEYFPAYEVMMDDLRDYRFYKSDMIHPSEQAEDYIWNRFVEKYMDSETSDFLQQWKGIYPALLHKPFHPASSGHQIFLRQTLHKLEQLRGVINIEEEIHSIQTQLLDSNNQTST